jgi:cell division protein FtsB
MLTLTAWNLLINALLTALMIVYGVWMRDIIRKQRELKDAAIDALKSALTAKEAEISKLRTDVAPNIVKAYAEMREHADLILGGQLKTGQLGSLQNRPTVWPRT